MRAFITGANGFVGSTLARRLGSGGEAPLCLVRSGADTSLIADLPVKIVAGDLDHPRVLDDAIGQCEVVFHLAGVRRAPTREAFFQVNAEGTRQVCAAIARSVSKPRLVLVSSLAAVGPRADCPDESSPFAPRDWYGESKAQAEEIARSYADRIDLTIARPSRILGPGDRENLFFFRLVKKGYQISLGGKTKPVFSFVDVEEVVDLLLLLGERREAVGEAFFVSHQVASLDQLQAEVAAVQGGRHRTISVSPTALRGLASLADFFSRLTGKHLPLNRKLAQQLLVPGWTCSSAKAKQLLGFEAKITIARSIARSQAWYQAHGWL